jgi:hypothetical protein
MVRVVWKDACEGPVDQNLSEQGKTRLRGSITTTISTIGRYLRTLNGYLILDDVIYEESDGALLYEKQAQGKWLSIPLGVIEEVVAVREVAYPIAREAIRRRTIFRHLKFIPRATRLTSGELSRMLYQA